MSGSELGLAEAVSMALGGMIGGGIYAVLGVVAGITGPATWFAFVVAGLVAACGAYSYTVLNGVDDAHQGGSVSFVQRFVGNSTLAGMTGWTLLVGYVGSMAMYAFAFGEFTVALDAVPDSVAAVPLRPLVSVAAVAGFVGLNLVGARATGVVENVLVAAKVMVLVAFGLGGIVYATSSGSTTISLGADQLPTFGPVIAAAVSFVAFQGWQLLFYDQESFEDPSDTIGRAVAIAIPAAVVVYVLVAVATVTLAPQAVTKHPTRRW
ncbi:APC family permease [Haloarcula regularis]|uniref:APC family permease n=1 Tax=Haloarcula regularis TaxID=3033392 RepID=UPI0023E86589|nr:APC family permease [Halomicroarcula sp. SYNS111]